MKLMHGNCLELMAHIPDGSVDMILCDLPYGTTACKWDTVIPFEPLWEQYKRIAKPNAAIVLTASQPFTSALVMSNAAMFKYEWVWEKSLKTNFLNAKKQPLRSHESILVFSEKQSTYNPQGLRAGNISGGNRLTNSYGTWEPNNHKQEQTGYPSSVLKISNPNQGNVHPTQKPVALMEYLIRTYTNEGETVLDSCMGSGTTGVSCVNTGRNFIGIEQDDKYFAIAKQRIESAQLPLLQVA